MTSRRCTWSTSATTKVTVLDRFSKFEEKTLLHRSQWFEVNLRAFILIPVLVSSTIFPLSISPNKILNMSQIDFAQLGSICAQAKAFRDKESVPFKQLFTELVHELTQPTAQPSPSSDQNNNDDPCSPISATYPLASEQQLSVVNAWIESMLAYNVPHGKLNRGLSLVINYRHLVPDAGERELRQARVLGWCMEMFQAYFLILDDIMDNSITRRGRPCWYRKVSFAWNGGRFEILMLSTGQALMFVTGRIKDTFKWMNGEGGGLTSGFRQSVVRTSKLQVSKFVRTSEQATLIIIALASLCASCVLIIKCSWW